MDALKLIEKLQGAFEEAGCDKEDVARIGTVEGNAMKVSDMLGGPIYMIPLLKKLGVDPKNYMWQEGPARVRAVGRGFRNEGYSLERGEMLADFLGRSFDRLYDELTVSDVARMYVFERENKVWKMAG